MTKNSFFTFLFYISGHITCSSCIKLQDQIDKQSSKFESHINELEKQKLELEKEKLAFKKQFLKVRNDVSGGGGE